MQRFRLLQKSEHVDVESAGAGLAARRQRNLHVVESSNRAARSQSVARIAIFAQQPVRNEVVKSPGLVAIPISVETFDAKPHAFAQTTHWFVRLEDFKEDPVRAQLVKRTMLSKLQRESARTASRLPDC